MSTPIALYIAWQRWFFDRWRNEGGFPGNLLSIERHVLLSEYNGFGGEF